VNPPEIQTFKVFIESAALGIKSQISVRLTITTIDGFRRNFQAGCYEITI
jgi:hypothetical protein